MPTLSGYAIKPTRLTAGTVLQSKTGTARYTVQELLPVGFRRPKPLYVLHTDSGQPVRATLSELRCYCTLEVPA